jgi:Zn-dependent peptidase ImmA (M78 family)
MSIGASRIKEIDSVSFDILQDAYGGGEKIVPPINLKSVIDKYGLKLKMGDFKDSDILGAYDKDKKTIYVAATETYTRKAFTIAHELGHFFLHNHKQTEFFFRSDILRMEQDEQEETEANKFAASLLMPKFLVERFWRQFRSIAIIARIFKVSHTAARYRLKNLNLIE